MAYGTDPNDVFIPPDIPFEGASALHLAVLKSNAPIVQVLLDNGADIEIKAKDVFEATPLIWAAYWGIPEMVRVLLEAGANINAEDANGFTPLDAASVENPFIARRMWKPLLVAGLRFESCSRSMGEGPGVRATGRRPRGAGVTWRFVGLTIAVIQCWQHGLNHINTRNGRWQCHLEISETY